MTFGLKIFLFYGGATKPEIRRFESNQVIVWEELCARLEKIDKLQGKLYSVYWKDEEGDEVKITNTEDLCIAVKDASMLESILKLYVYCNDAKCEANEGSIAGPSVGPNILPTVKAEHYGVLCDACDNQVYGFRYKCTSCDDYDLCSKCEAEGKHPDHCMVRVPTPLMPRDLIKSAIKRSRHFLKTVVDPECNKKNKRERSNERKHHRREHKSECRRQQGSWVDTFAKYMNEFANLAGDIEVPQPQTQNNQSETEAKKDKETVIKPENMQYLLDIQKALTEAIVTKIPNANEGSSENTVAGSSENNVGENVNTSVAVNQGNAMNVEDAGGDSKAPESDKASVASSEGAKGDMDWTVIKENDFVYVAKDDKPEACPPIGFNLPKEFQERMTLKEGGQYPTLNPTAAVLNLNKPAETVNPQSSHTQTEPQANTTQEQWSQTQANQANKEQAKPGTQTPPKPVFNLKPHIEKALQIMQDMGFNNDSGWLTQLLEKYNGDIAAVLEVLTPVMRANTK